MSKQKKIMLSAVQPSNRLTLGNYLGAVKNWVQHQASYDCIFFAVDLHTITVRQDPVELREQTYRILATYLAAGIKQEEATLFVQSHVPEHAELGWILSCYAYMGELSRMTQFKDKSAKHQNVGTGLFTYPTLMAADILLYDTNLVPVGDDQKQHVEITRDLAMRLNKLYPKEGERDLFVIPEHFMPPVGARIMSLQNPLAKMSKSDPDPNSAIYLSDSDDQILKKFKKAVTDSGTEITYDAAKPGIKNLLDIQGALKNEKPEAIAETYRGKQYGHLKIETADLVIEALRPIRDEIEKNMADRSKLDTILQQGAQKARQRASVTLARVNERLGFLPGRYPSRKGDSV